MESVFPVEEIPDALWSPLPPQEQPVQPPAVGDGGVSDCQGAASGGAMDQDRAAAEWSFERILEEALLDDGHTVAADPGPGAAPYAADPAVSVGGEYADPAVPASGGTGGGYGMAETVVEREDMSPEPLPAAAEGAAVDPVEYNAVLKRKLVEDLAAVAIWRTSGAKHPKISQGSDNYVGGSGILVQKKSDGEPGHLVQNADIRGKQATDFSSREPSSTDDDDYGEVEILGFMIPDVEKVRKRKESNRESARRSRNRKAAHMKDLEDQVAQLRVENSSLLRRLAALNQKYNDATVDNRVLKADIETLKAQVKMAAEAVKRFTGMSPLPAKPVSDMPSHGIIFHGSASDANNDASAPIQDYFATTTDHRVNNSSMPNLTPCFQGENAINGRLTASRKINRIASQHAMALEDLNKAMCGMPTSPGSAPWSWASLDPNEFVNMEMH